MDVNLCRGLGAIAGAGFCGCEWVDGCGCVGGEVVVVAILKVTMANSLVPPISHRMGRSHFLSLTH